MNWNWKSTARDLALTPAHWINTGYRKGSKLLLKHSRVLTGGKDGPDPRLIKVAMETLDFISGNWMTPPDFSDEPEERSLFQFPRVFGFGGYANIPKKKNIKIKPIKPLSLVKLPLRRWKKTRWLFLLGNCK